MFENRIKRLFGISMICPVSAYPSDITIEFRIDVIELMENNFQFITGMEIQKSWHIKIYKILYLITVMDYRRHSIVMPLVSQHFDSTFKTKGNEFSIGAAFASVTIRGNAYQKFICIYMSIERDLFNYPDNYTGYSFCKVNGESE